MAGTGAAGWRGGVDGAIGGGGRDFVGGRGVRCVVWEVVGFGRGLKKCRVGVSATHHPVAWLLLYTFSLLPLRTQKLLTTTATLRPAVPRPAPP